MAGIADEDTEEEKDKGELMYQESKQFHSEWFLCNAYDNPKARRVTFEIYGLDTQDMFTKSYDYAAFDGLFRFNAELMNPNRKEGRFHYIIERLAIVTVNKERELKLMPEPSEEVPQLPTYETTRKIPTGRMDLKERQRLREQMDMLDIRRTENIAKKRNATKQRILQHIMKLKEEDRRKKEAVDKKIAEERKLRYKLKEEAERKEREEEAKIEQMKKVRRKAVEVKEERTEEQDEEEYRQLRARWRVKDAEKAQIAADLKARKLKEREEKAAAEQKQNDHQAEVTSRREVAWAARAERVRKKEAAKIKSILEIKQEMERKEKLQKERNNEFLQLVHMERQPIFKAQLERTEERKQDAASEAEALTNYKERRAIPKKVNKKSSKDPAKRDSKDSQRPKGKAKPKSKSDKESDTEGGAGTDTGGKGLDPEKVLDAVEAKMRKEMEEQRKRDMKDRKRTKKIKDKLGAWEEREREHNAEVREAYRQNVTAKEQTAAERRLVMQQRKQEQEAAVERQKAERSRLERLRAQNIAKREQARLQTLTA